MTAPALPTQRTPDAWQLVERAQAGDREAMADIYRANYDTVYRFIYGRVFRNRQLAEDLTEDVFERMLRCLHTVEWRGRDIGAWLTTIARNRVADHFKSGRYRLEFTVGEMFDDELPVADSYAGPEDATVEHLENARARAALRDALASLESFEQKLAVELRYIDGLSVRQTAEAMRLTEGAVKSLTLRAMGHLRRNWRVRSLVAA